MAKLLIVCLVCIIVASPWLTSCTAARRLQPSMPSGNVHKSTETTTSSSNPTGVGADVNSTHQSTTSSFMAESSEEVTDADLDQLSKLEINWQAKGSLPRESVIIGLAAQAEFATEECTYDIAFKQLYTIALLHYFEGVQGPKHGYACSKRAKNSSYEQLTFADEKLTLLQGLVYVGGLTAGKWVASYGPVHLSTWTLDDLIWDTRRAFPINSLGCSTSPSLQDG